MSTQIISRRYARALLNLSGRGPDLDAMAQALDETAAAVCGPQVTAFLARETASADAKGEVLKQVLAKIGGPATLSPFVRLLHQKRRLALLPEIASLFRSLADERLGRAQAEVTVAEPLSEAVQERLRKQIEKQTGKTVTLHVQVDPALLGGAVTRVGSVVWDGSVRHYLDRVRERLLSG
ncbi:MAG: ATP synthase F1 subunit delta [SAR324 cluster bacterium]